MPKTSTNRNPTLIPGVEKYGRAAAYKRSGRWAVKNKTVVPAQKPVEKKVKTFGKGERVVTPKRPRSYEPVPNRSRLGGKVAPRPTHLRKSITPGTVLILLAGRFRGKRVVFLKQLDSGLLLVTGPYKFNGVPLRRVNQAYVIATSTRVSVEGVSIPESVNDAYFKKPKSRAAKSEENFFDASKKQPIDASKIADQKAVDAAIVKNAQGVELLKAYLSSRFSLKRGQFPHEMKF